MDRPKGSIIPLTCAILVAGSRVSGPRPVSTAFDPDRKSSVNYFDRYVSSLREWGTWTGMNDILRLAELLCARLCHDLAGPLGALIGVLEIARDEDPNSDTLALAELTTVELGQRLKLLRAAWGQDAEPLDLDTLQGHATGLVMGSRPVRLDLTGLAPDTTFPPPQARLVLNVVLLAA